MGDWWTCNRCGHAFGEFGVDRPSGCTQCHSADLAPGLTPPTDSERLARLEKDLRELRERFLRRETDYRARAPYDGSGSACGDCASAVEDLMRENDISPDGEGGG